MHQNLLYRRLSKATIILVGALLSLLGIPTITYAIATVIGTYNIGTDTSSWRVLGNLSQSWVHISGPPIAYTSLAGNVSLYVGASFGVLIFIALILCLRTPTLAGFFAAFLLSVVGTLGLVLLMSVIIY